MDINTLLSTVILVTFVLTIILATGSYMVFKSRERRRPRAAQVGQNSAPMFFERIRLQGRVHEAGSKAPVRSDRAA